MTKPMIYKFDAETQEEVLCEMTDLEHSQYLLDVAEFEARRLEVEAQSAAKAVAKAELLTALNLSQETLDLLNGLN